ncbi:MAG: polyphenol oxidase family protein [Calditerrivibrio sp.]|nr:polyphenol oxidase family protein [Calditerrivibrio sp.]
MLNAYKGIMYIRPKNTPKGILQLYTTRFGGKSRGEFSSFNLGFFTNDNNVIGNYHLLKKILDISHISIVKQVHSAEIFELNSRGEKALVEADGIFTSLEGVVTGIQTADCWTVQLIGCTYVCNLHCGWRSVYFGIVENGLELFYKKNDRVVFATVGPGICVDCYEVGGELIERFSKVSNGGFYKRCNGRFYMDIGQLIREKLEKHAILNVEYISYCSFCKDYLYSYRRDHGKTGRMLSLLGKL